MRLPQPDLIAAALAAALLSPGSAQARDYFEPFPFFMTSDVASIAVSCDGPFLRTSSCVPLGRVHRQEFYRAYNTIFSASGYWECAVFSRSDCEDEKALSNFTSTMIQEI